VRLLVVEDEPQLGEQLVSALSAAGYAVDRADDGERGQFLAEIHPYDAVVLDIGLPRLDGLTVLRCWRDAGLKVPVVILTARGSWHEKVEGIDAGADDYVSKPFRMEELLARIRALIRRASGGGALVELRSGAVALDTRSGRVTRDGAPVSLTAHELRVLSYLLHHRGRIVSRAELSEHIYAEDLDRDSNTIEVFVARLRRKLGPDFVETVRGLGYRIDGAP
jgi:two-component system, OmpR family, response regulator